MNKSLRFTALASLMGIAFVPFEAKALPFKNDCASMQAFFNAVQWKNPTRFSGFESPKEPIEVGNTVACLLMMEEGGYAVESSPMGTKACNNVILEYDKNSRVPSWRNDGGYIFKDSGTCRYR